MKSKFLAAVALVVLVSVLYAVAQEEQLHISSVSIPRPGEVSALLKPPPGASPKASDFELINNNVVIPAQEAKRRDLDVTLLVDVSNSMKGGPLDDTRTALKKFLEDTTEKDRIELVSFADNDTVESKFTDTRQNLASAIDEKLWPRGNKTVLLQALHNSLARPASNPENRRIFIVISDGKDEGSPEKYRKIEKALKDSGVTIHTIFRGRVGPEYTRVLQDLANATGGQYTTALNEEQIRNALQTVYSSEPRFLVVRFAYETDPSGKKTDGAAIVLKQSGKPALKASLGAEIPLGVIPDHGNRIREALTWLLPLLLGAFLLGAIVWARRDRRIGPILVGDTGPGGVGGRPGQGPEPPHPPEPQAKPNEATRIAPYFPLSSGGYPSITLLGLTGSVEGRQFTMKREIFRIGANADNDLSIPDDHYISAKHACLRYEDGSLLIFDQGSRNGTFVNEQKLTDAGLVLRPGDRIRVGTSMFEVAPHA